MNKLISVISACLLLGLSGAVLADGEKIYKQSCQACHANGVANAPKPGDKAAWAPRIAAGKDAMIANATKGKNAMPPMGTCMECSPEEIAALVDYMVNKSQ